MYASISQPGNVRPSESRTARRFSRARHLAHALLLLTLAFLSPLPPEPAYGSEATVPPDASHFGENAYYVYGGVDASTWQDAQAYCESLGGHLATIGSSEENAFLYDLVTSSGFGSAYFGLSDETEEGVWAWVTGEEVAYTNWSSGEPNNKNGIEDYGMFYYGSSATQWNDGDFGLGPANGGTAFICEWDLGPAGETQPDGASSPGVDCQTASEALDVGYYPWLAEELLTGDVTSVSAYRSYTSLTDPQYVSIAEGMTEQDARTTMAAILNTLSNGLSDLSQQHIYETIILEWLAYDGEDVDSWWFPSEAFALTADAYGMTTDLHQYALKVFGAPALETLSNAPERVGILDGMGVALDVGQLAMVTTEELFDALAGLDAAYGATPEKIELLKWACDAAGDDPDFVAAADHVIDAYAEQSSDLAFSLGAAASADVVTAGVMTALTATNPILGAGMDFLDIVFGAGDTSSARMGIIGVYVVGNYLHLGQMNAADEALASLNETGSIPHEVAEPFVACLGSYLDYQLYALDEASSWASYFLKEDSGTLRKLFTTPSASEGAQDIIDRCAAQARARVAVLNLISSDGAFYFDLAGRALSDECQDGSSAGPSTEEELRAALANAGCTDPLRFWMADFDGDGTFEAFALDGEPETPMLNESWDGGLTSARLWFAAGSGIAYVVDDSMAGIHTRGDEADLPSNGSRTFLDLLSTAHGSSGSSTVYTVRDGLPIEVPLDESGKDGLKAGRNGLFIAGGHDFSHEYHMRTYVYYTFDETSFSFSKVGATPPFDPGSNDEVTFSGGLRVTITFGWDSVGDKEGPTAGTDFSYGGGSWFHEGIIRTDSAGDVYLRMAATVDGSPAEVAWYGGANLYECAGGLRVEPTATEGCFTVVGSVPWEDANGTAGPTQTAGQAGSHYEGEPTSFAISENPASPLSSVTITGEWHLDADGAWCVKFWTYRAPTCTPTRPPTSRGTPPTRSGRTGAHRCSASWTPRRACRTPRATGMSRTAGHGCRANCYRRQDRQQKGPNKHMRGNSPLRPHFPIGDRLSRVQIPLKSEPAFQPALFCPPAPACNRYWP